MCYKIKIITKSSNTNFKKLFVLVFYECKIILDILKINMNFWSETAWSLKKITFHNN